MSIGQFIPFEKASPGQWLITPDGQRVHLKVKHKGNEERALSFSQSDVHLTSISGAMFVYVLENVDIFPDLKSFTQNSNIKGGELYLAANGIFFPCVSNGFTNYISLHSGTVDSPAVPSAWFRKWTLIQKTTSGGAVILSFNNE